VQSALNDHSKYSETYSRLEGGMFRQDSEKSPHEQLMPATRKRNDFISVDTFEISNELSSFFLSASENTLEALYETSSIVTLATETDSASAAVPVTTSNKVRQYVYRIVHFN
jgi:hypothetical protein